MPRFKSRQKFQRGDRVRIAKELGPMMSHFGGKGCQAIVLGSYNDQFGGGNIKSYSLLVYEDKEWYSCSWYEEYQLTLISRARMKSYDIIQEHQERHLDELS